MAHFAHAQDDYVRKDRSINLIGRRDLGGDGAVCGAAVS
jgi:hypothetical protein